MDWKYCNHQYRAKGGENCCLVVDITYNGEGANNFVYAIIEGAINKWEIFCSTSYDEMKKTIEQAKIWCERNK